MTFKAPNRLSVLIIWLPMALGTLYYVFIAANRYVSESIITVRQADETNQSNSGLMAGLGFGMPGTGGPDVTDINYLSNYIYSLDMLRHLDAKLGLRKMYETNKRDLFYRLFPWFSQEWFLWYYRNRVGITVDSQSSMLFLSVEGFLPEQAKAISQEIMAQSERFINEISYRMAREQMGYAESYLNRAHERYQVAKDSLIDFQNRNHLFDPIAQAQAKAGLSNELEAALSKDEAELKNALTFLNDKSYQILALKNRINATRAQIQEERGRSAAPEGTHLNELAGEFQHLTLDAAFAEDTYRVSLSTVEKIRLETSRKLKHLVVIATPTLPEWPRYPGRIYNLCTMLLVLTLFYGMTRLVIAIIEDHRD